MIAILFLQRPTTSVRYADSRVNFLMDVARRHDRDPVNFSPVSPSASDPSPRIADAVRRGDVRVVFAKFFGRGQ